MAFVFDLWILTEHLDPNHKGYITTTISMDSHHNHLHNLIKDCIIITNNLTIPGPGKVNPFANHNLVTHHMLVAVHKNLHRLPILEEVHLNLVVHLMKGLNVA